MIPAVVVLAAKVAVADHSGVIEYRIHQTSQIDGGPIHKRDDIAMVVVADGDRIVGVRIFNYVENGKQQSAQTKASLAASLTGETRRFAAPFDARSFADYSYTVEGSTVHFRGIKRDAFHGDGTFTVDGAGHVTQITYSPDVLQQFATSESVAQARGEVLPGFWATTTTVTSIQGHYLIFHGGASSTLVQSGFRRFADREKALRDLDALQE
ncbi:MAG TPA: hypothetical protein VIJ12_11150 [Candidatus Baltobacteraceae bacterium]